MMALVSLLIALVASAPTAPPAATLRASLPAELDGFDDYVRRAVADWEVPGLAIAVIGNGEVLFERGYGIRRLGAGEPVDEHTLFAIGSTTKAMTAALIGMLVDSGRLRWDDRVIDHLPDFRLFDPWVTRELRVRDLLTHSAGLPNADFLWYEQDATLDQILHRMRYLEPETSMRSSFTYQNILYAAAGKLVAVASGESWASFLESRIFRPLGMNRSVATLAATAGVANVAVPHDVFDGALIAIDNASVDSVSAAGSVWSSVHDMAQWSRFLLAGGVTPSGERLLSEAAYAELFRPQVVVDEPTYPAFRLTNPRWLTYGLGWFQADYEGRPTDFHTGSIDGLVAIHGMMRGERIGVIVLANRDHTELRHALMYRVFDLFDEDPPRDWSTELRELYASLAREAEQEAEHDVVSREAQRIAGTSPSPPSAPSLPLAVYAGSYRDPLYGEVEVSFDAGSGLAARYGRRSGHLEPFQRDSFRVRWDQPGRGDVVLIFGVTSGGEISHLELSGMRLGRSPDAR